ncbi:hypothetical protein BaRGS_00033273 [Batillaria attramentaria]|uniref:Thymidylate kinase n=1 Tax=Batillaria attramentaria TaxID=370345 RepID=A0ABD0JM25_9CAEN|nr:hypothetical protein BaRGS_027275 [Batillaria attramentaria]
MPGSVAERGAFIVFEGCDKSGKSTQCSQLVQRLNDAGVKAELLKFPDRTTTIGKMINSYLQQSCQIEDHAIHLLFTANRWEAMPRMTELLQSGVTLVVDRYSFSGVAYSAAKPDFSVEWCQQPERGLLRPDHVFYLTLSPEVAAQRGDYGTERYEKKEIQAKAAANFDLLKDETWTVINADKTKEDLSTEIFEHAMKVVDSSKQAELAQLWLK